MVAALAAWPAKTPRKLVLAAALVMTLGTLAVARQAPGPRRWGSPVGTCFERLERGVSYAPVVLCRALSCSRYSCFFLFIGINADIFWMIQKTPDHFLHTVLIRSRTKMLELYTT